MSSPAERLTTVSCPLHVIEYKYFFPKQVIFSKNKIAMKIFLNTGTVIREKGGIVASSTTPPKCPSWNGTDWQYYVGKINKKKAGENVIMRCLGA